MVRSRVHPAGVTHGVTPRPCPSPLQHSGPGPLGSFTLRWPGLLVTSGCSGGLTSMGSCVSLPRGQTEALRQELRRATPGPVTEEGKSPGDLDLNPTARPGPGVQSAPLDHRLGSELLVGHLGANTVSLLSST